MKHLSWPNIISVIITLLSIVGSAIVYLNSSAETQNSNINAVSQKEAVDAANIQTLKDQFTSSQQAQAETLNRFQDQVYTRLNAIDDHVSGVSSQVNGILEYIQKESK